MLVHEPKDLALLVRTHRKKIKLSQSALAMRVGLKQQTISAFEQNAGHAKVSTLFRILSAVGLDIMITLKDHETAKNEW